ncbi:tetratricopeptide repeat protein [Bifidobacterium actinocoloniiforme]|nr:hypothetical protein [Bifidobacterium actinocoloniiforme]
MPKGLEWSMLSKDDKVRLRGLSKEHAENTGLHILAAYALEESDPERALAHAKWVAKQASRVDIARETLALVAYRQGDYKLALKEFRTAYRMNGYTDYLPFIADCERGLGHPRKAVEEATSEAAKELRGESKAEMFLVYAGALGDLGLWDKAIETVRALARAKGLSGDYLMRALQAEQNFLEQIGRADESHKLDPVLDRLEAEYAESDEDEEEQEIIVDNDLEHATASMLEDLDIPLYGGEDEAEDGQASNQEDSPETLGQAEPDQDDTARASAAESAGSTSEPDAEQPDDQATDGAAVDAAESAVSESPRVPAAPDQSASEPGAEPEPPSETNIPAAESGEDWTQEDQA